MKFSRCYTIIFIISNWTYLKNLFYNKSIPNQSHDFFFIVQNLWNFITFYNKNNNTFYNKNNKGEPSRYTGLSRPPNLWRLFLSFLSFPLGETRGGQEEIEQKECDSCSRHISCPECLCPKSRDIKYISSIKSRSFAKDSYVY